MPDVSPSPPRSNARTLRWTIFLGATALVVWACLLILQPFVNVIAWSAVLAIAFHPVHRRLARRIGHVSISAFLCSALVVVAIVIPTIFVVSAAIDQLLALRDYLLRPTPGVAAAGTPLERLDDWLVRIGVDTAVVRNWIGEHANDIAAMTAQYSLALAANITGVIVSFVFTVFAMFLLFRDGERIVAWIAAVLPFDAERNHALLVHVREVILGSLYGIVVIALLQGALCGGMFWILGIPSAALWGTLTVLISVLPLVGAATVWVPGVLYLALTGQWVQTAVLAVWGTFVISGIDNFLRPRLVAGRVGLNELVMFFALLGGLHAFGFLGILLGPLLFAIAASIIDVLRRDGP
jgi:predicted PurR-regulated permease PerM